MRMQMCIGNTKNKKKHLILLIFAYKLLYPRQKAAKMYYISGYMIFSKDYIQQLAKVGIKFAKR